MQERPDDEAANEGLDRLFRKSAEEFEPPYEPAVWQIMSAKLDERDRVTIWGRVLRGSLAIMAFIVLLSGSWYVYKQNKVKTPVTELETTRPEALWATSGETRIPEKRSAVRNQSAEPASPVVAANDMSAAPLETSTSKRIRSEQPSITESTIESKLPDPKNNVAKSIVSQSEQETAGRHLDDQPMEIETSQRGRLSWPVVRQHSSPERVIKRSNNPESGLKKMTALGAKTSLKEGSGADLTPFVETKLLDKKLERVVAVDRPISEQTGSMGELPGYRSAIRTTTDAVVDDSATFSSEQSRIGPLDALSSRDVMRWPQWPTLAIPALSLPQSGPAAEKSANPIRERGLSVRVVLSPDLSAVGINNFARPGRNYGLLLEYRFGNRLSAQVGVIQSKKIYTATPEKYTWPADWKWYVKPVGVDGQCSMLDIPINLRYDFLRVPTRSGRLPAKRSRAERSPAERSPALWFVSGGLTTYIMQSEQYDYNYANPADTRIRVRSWSGKTGRYNVSNLNLSMGYERAISRRFSWQVEPFVKVPLKGVGFFKVRLLSTGAFLSLRYRL